MNDTNPSMPKTTSAANQDDGDVAALRQRVRQLQDQLAEIADQNRQWQAIYNGVQESIVLVDTDGVVLSLNPATERITGRKTAEVIGRHVGELFPKIALSGSGIEYQGPSGFYQSVQESRPSDLLEAVVETKDKRHIWVNYTYTPLWDSNGTMIALVRVTSDVSRVKAVEQMKNDFVSIASHELRTPLGVMNGYLSLFLAGQLGDLTDSQKMFIERIYHSSMDMALLVEDLLNVSRIEAGRLELVMETYDLATLIERTIGELTPRYESKQQQIVVAFDQPSVVMNGDSKKVGQALTNIIDNAIKYTYDNGTITIRLHSDDADATVEVVDSGVGIQPDHLDHIFEKYYRENNPLSVKEGGSGLGLYISRKLVELHGGDISVTSQQGNGSTFAIVLPHTSRSRMREEGSAS